MKIQKASLNELLPLSVLFNDYRIFYRKEADLEAAGSFLKQRIENGDAEIFVCFNELNEMTGFTQLYPLFSSTRMKRLWLLNDLFVHPDHRSKGYSIALIERAKQLCKETEACGMFLETEKTNIIGNQLYPKTGFYLNETSNFYQWDII
ncbi:MAG: GNAT family N-acetyltransferase [Bacteroidetes bacterium]|nr:GNAT family N-acetyltransferase [Bacteroidota bacterium]